MHSFLDKSPHISYIKPIYVLWEACMQFKTAINIFISSLFSSSIGMAQPTPWSYDGQQDGQDNWGMLSPDYTACELGTKQSPVVIAYTTPTSLPALTFSYNETAATASITEHMLDIAIKGRNILRINNEPYALTNIQFHSPSEHTIKDDFYLMEIHLVHKSFDGKQLNLALFVETGEANTALSTITNHLPNQDKIKTQFNFNPTTLLPTSFGYYAYSGSLSRPPCSEDVEWRVLKTPLVISKEQLIQITKLIGRNARLEQPIYSRTILETTY